MKKIITDYELDVLCHAFHKWFRVADCKYNADIDMYKAINKLDGKEYVQAMKDSLKEIGIEIKGD